MSTEYQTDLQIGFDSYGAALSKVLEIRGLKKSALARSLIDDPSKQRSMETMIYRWCNGHATPSELNRKQVADLLSVTIKQNTSGKWMVIPDVQGILGKKSDSQVGLLTDGNARDELIGYLQERLKALSSELEEVSRALGALRK